MSDLKLGNDLYFEKITGVATIKNCKWLSIHYKGGSGLRVAGQNGKFITYPSDMRDWNSGDISNDAITELTVDANGGAIYCFSPDGQWS